MHKKHNKTTKKGAKRQRSSKQQLPLLRNPSTTQWQRRGGRPYADYQLSYTLAFNMCINTTDDILLFNPNSYIPEYSGTKTAAGYNEIAAQYDFYRVVRFKMDIILTNDSIPTCDIGFIAANEDFSSYSFSDLADNPFGRIAHLGTAAGGASRTRWVKPLNMTTLVGSDAPETDDNYRAVINAHPADVVWSGFKVHATSALVSGVSGVAQITQWYRFYTQDIVKQETAPSFKNDKQYLDDLVQMRNRLKQAHSVAARVGPLVYQSKEKSSS